MDMRNAMLKTVLLSGACMIAPYWAPAQSPGTGAIAGRVTDATDAEIPNTTVKAVDEATHDSRSSLTSQQGGFRMSLLSPGTYSVSVAASGFETQVVTEVNVVAGETTRLAVRQAGGETEGKGQVNRAGDLA